jgi:hypothetical protein
VSPLMAAVTLVVALLLVAGTAVASSAVPVCAAWRRVRQHDGPILEEVLGPGSAAACGQWAGAGGGRWNRGWGGR